MSSIRTKATLFTMWEVIIAVATVTLLAVFFINGFGNSTSDQILSLLCETGEKNIDGYFESVEQSVKTVSGYASSDLEKTDLNELGDHTRRVRELFEKTARNTSGVLTYYYRIDPSVSSESGFWYVYSSRNGFIPHNVTDITLYDTNDQSALVWFTVPKATGTPKWLAPYITENFDAYVLSYNVPIYKDGVFIGVIGIEIDYGTMAKAVDNITLYQNGYAFITDDEGRLVYHPRIDVAHLSDEEKSTVPNGLMSEESNVRYTYEGVLKQGVWTPLSNGMRLYVTAPIQEINATWQKLVYCIVVASVVLLFVSVLLTRHFMSRITHPLHELTIAAEHVNEGNYDVELSYDKNDEMGVLTQTVRRLIEHLKVHMEELHSLAYADALTHVHNKGAFNITLSNLQVELDGSSTPPEFAIGVFDCDYLKQINDNFGHDKGDIYLQTACSTICHVFEHSPVFRIGGDEFTVIVQGEDFEHRDELLRQFETMCSTQRESAKERWEQISVSLGLAIYDPSYDESVEDVVRRADKLMYEAKRSRKGTR